MYRLSLLIFVHFWVFSLYAQSPHGESLKLDCADCHDPSSWTKISDSILFDHNNTEFPLVETHQLVDCKQCHSSLIFQEANSDCVACHTDVHSMSVGNDCARCHTPQNWLVDHIPELHEENGFPLIGTHGTLSCVDCHLSETNLRFDRIGNDCINCHMDDYNSTQSPNHVAAGFSTYCIDCHAPYADSWQTEFIDHSFFPLIEGHDIQDCGQCHTSSNFSNTSSECVSCHLNDYSSSTSPNHNNAGFSTDCADCHDISSWVPSNWDHNTVYPLKGAHLSIANDCKACHSSDFSNPIETCFNCHETEYNNTTDPNHSNAQFPTNCLECHNENSWIPSSWDHDVLYFPIYSGKHAQEWNLCTECHTNSSNYAIYSCIDCHEHSDKVQVDDDHSSVSGYVYTSNACFNCHPLGEK